jgi:hypothetical protein
LEEYVDTRFSIISVIEELIETELELTKEQDFLEKKIEQELSDAEKYGTKNKRGISLSVFLFCFFFRFS